MESTLLQTPLHAWHGANHGRLVDFAGWHMPVQYTSIVAEHTATRTAAGLFDISHMGRLCFTGAGAAGFLDSVVTRRITDLKPGGIRYGLVTNEAGGILDDVLVYRLAAHTGSPFASQADESYYLMVVNASNRLKILAWLAPRLAACNDVTLADITIPWAMIAVQGPRALPWAQPLIDVALAPMRYYTGQEATIAGATGIVSRTGYTGEDGVELIVPAERATDIWQQLVTAGATPAGLGCRDTLRLEAAMPLYGHELTEAITPLEAGLAFAVNLEGRTFPGHDALVKRAGDSSLPVRVGLEFSGKRVPRENFAVLRAGEPVGITTSGTFSPTLNRPIAMAYVQPAAAAVGTSLTVDVRGREEPAVVVPLPFYRRS